MSASFCKPPRPALISTGAPSGLLRLSLSNSAAVENVPRLRRQRQQADQDVGPPQERLELRFAVKAFDAVDLLSGSGSSPRRESPMRSSTSAACSAERAQPHDADRDRARRPLRFRRPALLALATPQIKLLPVVHQHVQHDIFGHPLGEVADRDAHQRHVRAMSGSAISASTPAPRLKITRRLGNAASSPGCGFHTAA